MPLRKTESRLPDRLLPDALGFHVSDQSSSINLISYLPSTIRFGRDKNFIQNKYLVFINENALPPEIEQNQLGEGLLYEWRIQIIDSINGEVYNFNDETSFGEFNIDIQSANISAALNPTAQLLVTVRLLHDNQELTSLRLRHTIEGQNQFIEDLLTTETILPEMGDPAITRLLGNDLLEYLEQAANELGTAQKLDFPKNLATAIAYLVLLERGSLLKVDNVDNTVLEDLLNSGAQELGGGFAALLPMGICGLKPHFSGMFYPKEPAAPFIPFQTINEAPFDEYRIFTNYIKMENAVDLYNLLRFPKTAIKLCTSILAAHQARNPAWSGITPDQFAEQEDFVKSIVSQLTIGPFNNLESYTALARRTFSIAWSPFIQSLFLGYFYKTIYVEVLDIRSGNPIRNAKVKQLYVTAQFTGPLPLPLTAFNQEMVYYPNDRISYNNDTLVIAAKRALYRLGNWGGTLTRRTQGAENGFANNNNWNNQVQEAYNRFWQDKYGAAWTVYTNNDDPPENAYLKAIIDDYNNHAFSNERGVLAVRIPYNFLEREGLVIIKIAFFEFATVLEELKTGNEALRRPNANPTNYEPTHFEVSWVGNQRVDWNDYNNEAIHFGWRATPQGSNDGVYLKAVQSLTVKDGEALDPQAFSYFYDAQTRPIHFVLFGMQWCQPVWAPIPAEITHWIRGKINPQTERPEGVTQPIPANVNRNLPIMVTKCTGTGSGQGRDYGLHVSQRNHTRDQLNQLIDNDQNNMLHINGINPITMAQSYINVPPRGDGDNATHDGTDYYAIDGQSHVFAPHGGEVCSVRGTPSQISSSEGYGIQRIILFRNFHFRLAHLHGDQNRNQQNADENIVNVEEHSIVQAGFRFGVAGRTFKEYLTSPYYPNDAPTHLHLEICVTAPNNSECTINPNIRVGNSLSIFNEFPEHRTNDALFLNNDSYRLFPCDCHLPAGEDNAADCAIRQRSNNATISSECWASRNLHCPYLVNQADFRYQAQLKYIFENQNINPNGGNNYLDPTLIDGILGNAPTNIEINATPNNGIFERTGQTAHDRRLIEVDFTPIGAQGIRGWIAAALITNNNTLTVNNLNTMLSSSVSNSRMALYVVVQNSQQLDFENYATNFSFQIHQQLLNTLAPYPRVDLNRVDR